VEDQLAPVPEEITSEIGRIIDGDGARSMRTVKGNLATPFLRGREGIGRVGGRVGEKNAPVEDR
jgi:hypothetical protein